jgi:hypothetical protein
MNFPVSIIPCLCFMTQIHHGILEIFATWRLAGTSIALVSVRSLKPEVFAASGSWIKLYMFPLTFDDFFLPVSIMTMVHHKGLSM